MYTYVHIGKIYMLIRNLVTCFCIHMCVHICLSDHNCPSKEKTLFFFLDFFSQQSNVPWGFFYSLYFN